MNAMIDWVIALRWNGMLALCLYWMPLAMCAYGYTLRTHSDYRKEVARRDKPGGHYFPELTVGVLVGRAFVTAAPIANLFAAIFDVAPGVFGDFFRWIGRVFDMPLVPKRKEPQP